MPDERIRVLLVDDHPMILKGLATTLGPENDIVVVGSAQNGAEAVGQFRKMQPDVTILDISLGSDVGGLEVLKAIRKDFPNARVIMFTVHKGEETIHRAIEAGAVTYLFKEALGDFLVDTIRRVHAGERPIVPLVGQRLADRLVRPALTIRELEVLRLMADGLRNKEIANRLKITDQTVQSHVRNIFEKLKVSDRTKAVTLAIQRGIIEMRC